ncbi:MAG TPA: chromate efflux transporter [Pyrinomonadaceae bacterium]
MPSWRAVFLYFFFLGFVNVGGPVAQITMMYNHMVERRHWLSKSRFVSIMSFCHMLPGPEALQLAIYVGYLKRRVWGGVLAGLTFILPGAAIMIFLSWLYVSYGRLPQVNAFLFILKPAVLGIIMAGAVKLGAASIRSLLLAAILAGSFVALSVAQYNLLLILLLAGLVNLTVTEGLHRFGKRSGRSRVIGIVAIVFAFPYIHPHWLRISWLFLKTGLFSFGGAYASLAFLQQGAVDEYRWVSIGQLLDGVAMSIATPGPFMLFSTFVGYLAGGIVGAIIATFFVFLPSFVFVLAGARYVERVRDNQALQAFLAGASAAVVGVIVAVTFELAPGALVGKATVAIAVTTFLAIVLLKIDVALIALVAILSGIGYVLVHGA